MQWGGFPHLNICTVDSTGVIKNDLNVHSERGPMPSAHPHAQVHM